MMGGMEAVLGVFEFGELGVVVPLVCLCFLALLAVMTAHRISVRLERIERLLERRGEGEELRVVDKVRKSRSSVGDFERFLLDEPARRNLSKSEQFAAYRAWRKEKGLSWGSREQELSGEKETKG